MSRTRIPVLIHHGPWHGRDCYTVCQAMQTSPTNTHQELDRALQRLTDRLRHVIRQRAEYDGQQGLAEILYDPPGIQVTTHSLTITLRDRMIKVRVPCLSWPAFAGTILMPIEHRELTVFVHADEDADRVLEQQLLDHTAALDRELRANVLSRYSSTISYLLDWVVVTVPRPRLGRQHGHADLASIFQARRAADGGWELSDVGICWNDLVDVDDQLPMGRRELIDQLSRSCLQKPVEPVALLGPPGVGKTAVVAAMVGEHMRTTSPGSQKRRLVYLLPPARLISGMMYVGQWEERLHAICSHCVKEGTVLHIDDPIACFHAGRSAGSDLTVGHVLKTYVQEGGLALIIEASWDTWQGLQEIDRGFTDCFLVRDVPQLPPATSLQILIRAARQLENQHQCTFTPEALRRILQLARRYRHRRVEPGSLLGLLDQVGRSQAGQTADSAAVDREFIAATGLSQRLIADQLPTRASGLETMLSERVHGQPEACNLLAKRLSLVTSRLADPDRPLLTALLIGPSGVGKTEMAKAIAGLLTDDDARLLRFDLNEYVGGDAVARLIGIGGGADGQLTGAVRRRPFSVILLDEIEKAHPDVHDLLLQVLGEGRLTDGQGELVDFANCVVLMTSNLGAREAANLLGFELGRAAQERDTVFRAAVEDFFRPEFVNRLDLILPFRALDDHAADQVLTTFLQQFFNRPGLIRRRSCIEVTSSARAALLARSGDPALGARALRRVLDQELGIPLARQLASQPPDQPQVIIVDYTDSWQVSVLPCVQEAAAALVDQEAIADQTGDLLSQTETALDEHHQPGGDLDQAAQWYYQQRDLLQDVGRHLDQVAEALEPKPALVHVHPRQNRIHRDSWQNRLRLEVLTAEHRLQDFLREQADAQRDDAAIADHRQALTNGIGRLAWVHRIVRSHEETSVELDAWFPGADPVMLGCLLRPKTYHWYQKELYPALMIADWLHQGIADLVEMRVAVTPLTPTRWRIRLTGTGATLLADDLIMTITTVPEEGLLQVAAIVPPDTRDLPPVAICTSTDHAVELATGIIHHNRATTLTDLLAAILHRRSAATVVRS